MHLTHNPISKLFSFGPLFYKLYSYSSPHVLSLPLHMMHGTQFSSSLRFPLPFSITHDALPSHTDSKKGQWMAACNCMSSPLPTFGKGCSVVTSPIQI